MRSIEELLKGIACPPQPTVRPASEDIIAYAHGELDEEKNRITREHLFSCDEWAKEVAALWRLRAEHGPIAP